MSDLSSTVGSGLADYFEKVCAKLHKWVEPLSEEQFWTNPFPYGNDVGHLVLHLTGNLNYYIGARIAGTGYIRDRDREFTEAARPAKEDGAADFRPRHRHGRRDPSQAIRRGLERIFGGTQHVKEPI